MSEVKRVLVLGGGSAGFLAALTLKRKLPELEVTVLRSKELGIIGVGEGTIPYVPEHLHGYLGVPLDEFFAQAQPAWKLGVRFIWGRRDEFFYPFTMVASRHESGLPRAVAFYDDSERPLLDRTSALMAAGKVFARLENNLPLIERNIAYHLENETFVGYLEKLAAQWGVIVREGLVAEVVRGPQGVAALQLAGGETVTADLFVDCSGFGSLLLGQTLGEPFESYQSTLFCDRAVVGGWARTNEPILPYTTAETMPAGWCWRIDHEQRINRGYVYASAFVSDDEAEADFRRLCPQVEKTRVVRFTTGSYRRAWVQNVVAIGNAAGFVEPLEATAIYVICAASQALTAGFRTAARRPEAAMQVRFNDYCQRIWAGIRRFLAVHYRFNERLDTPFWRACQADVNLAGAEPIVDFYREYGPDPLWTGTLVDLIDPFRLDGYFCLLHGQGVPFRRRHDISDAERLRWAELQGEWKGIAAQGVPPEEAHALVRHPQWRWTPGFYG